MELSILILTGRDLFVTSDAITTVLEGIIDYPPQDPKNFLETFQLTIVGSMEFYEEIWNGFVGLSQSKSV